MHCITDPEQLLLDPEYLLRVVTSSVREDEPADWRLVVLEDAGELMDAPRGPRSGRGSRAC